MTDKKWAYDDFVEGATTQFGSKTVTAEENHRIRERIRSAANACRRSGR
jgi:hypothetical protein